MTSESWYVCFALGIVILGAGGLALIGYAIVTNTVWALVLGGAILYILASALET